MRYPMRPQEVTSTHLKLESDLGQKTIADLNVIGIYERADIRMSVQARSEPYLSIYGEKENDNATL